MNLSLINLHPSLRLRLPEWRKKVLRMARRLARSERVWSGSFDITTLEIAFLDDPLMAGINQRHLGHQGPTDVITFDYGKGRAEILVSLDTAMRQGHKHRKSLSDELTLYLAHGMLHLAGFDDRDSSHRRMMRREEQWLLRKLKYPD